MGREHRQATPWNLGAATGHWTAGLSAPLGAADASTLVMRVNPKDFRFSARLVSQAGVIWQAGRTTGVEETHVWDLDFCKKKCDSQ